jgi:hypothetical protein
VKAILGELAAVAAGLLITAAAVGPGRDRGVLVPPPEAAAENFLKAMAEHRYTQAPQYLAAGVKGTEPGELAALHASLERAYGAIEGVQGEDASIAGEESTARASLRFAGGPRDLRLPLRREKGLWKVASLDPLRALAAAGPLVRFLLSTPTEVGRVELSHRTFPVNGGLSMDPISVRPADRGSAELVSAATMTDIARCSVELDAIRDAMAVLALSRLADTSAWVQTSWAVAQAEGALRKAASGWWIAPPPAEELAGRVRSAWAALRALESLGQGPARWPPSRPR